MDIEAKERLTRYRDTSDEAVARRLLAARNLVDKSQKRFAELVGIGKTTYNSQEIKGKPSREVLDFLYRNSRIGPNFIYYGEFLPLPGDVQLALLAALREIDSAQAKGSAEGSDLA